MQFLRSNLGIVSSTFYFFNASYIHMKRQKTLCQQAHLLPECTNAWVERGVLERLLCGIYVCLAKHLSPNTPGRPGGFPVQGGTEIYSGNLLWYFLGLLLQRTIYTVWPKIAGTKWFTVLEARCQSRPLEGRASSAAWRVKPSFLRSGL